MSNRSTDVKCTWTNAVIWVAIATVVSVAIRYGLWYFTIYQGDIYVFTNDFCYASIPLLLVSVLIFIVLFVCMYAKYMRLAAAHPEDLHGVAIGRYGKPVILPLILQIALELLWIFVSLVVIIVSCRLEFGIDDHMTVILTFAALSGVNLVLNLGALLLGNRFFQPNLVRNHH